MPRSLSSLKRTRQNIKRAEVNKARRSNIKSRIRKVTDAVIARDPKAAEAALKQAIIILDRNATRGTIHANTAARRKSRLTRQINALKAAK